MAITPLQQEFIKKLRAVIRDHGLRQLDVARELRVTTSAVSQIMHGKIQLSPERFQTAAEKLGFPPLEVYELTRMLRSIRAGNTAFLSLWNQRIFCSRHAHGLTRSACSLLCDIPAERLQALEEDASASPTQEELHRLNHVFRWGRDQDCDYEVADSGQPPLQILPIQEVPKTEILLPFLQLEDCNHYSPGEDLLEFAVRHTSRHLAHIAIPEAVHPVAVLASAEALGFPYPGTITLILSEKRPYGFSALSLSCFPEFRYILLQHSGREGFLSPYELDMVFPPQDTPLWSLPVYEVIFNPINLRSFDYEFFQ